MIAYASIIIGSAILGALPFALLWRWEVSEREFEVDFWHSSWVETVRELIAIKVARSETTRKGNATKRAKILAKAEELRRAA